MPIVKLIRQEQPKAVICPSTDYRAGRRGMQGENQFVFQPIDLQPERPRHTACAALKAEHDDVCNRGLVFGSVCFEALLLLVAV